MGLALESHTGRWYAKMVVVIICRDEFSQGLRRRLDNRLSSDMFLF